MRDSFKVALCGVIAALCLACLFLTGLFPFATYSIPCMSGLFLVILVVECGAKWAWLTYGAVSILSLLLTPDREAALIFIFFFGFYPIVKARLEQISFRPLEYFLKLLLFNGSVLLCYWVILSLFQIKEVLDGMGDFGLYSALAMLGVGNVVFLLYDFAATQLISLYHSWFRKKLFKK